MLETLTEAQKGAILALATKVFRKDAKKCLQEMLGDVVWPNLTKAQASNSIDQLRAQL